MLSFHEGLSVLCGEPNFPMVTHVFEIVETLCSTRINSSKKKCLAIILESTISGLKSVTFYKGC